MQKVLVCTFCFLLVMMGLSNAQSGQWVWVSGSSSPNSSGNYGVKGVSAPGNMPPARYQAAYWIDKQGNYWIFGGSEASGFGHNDLWRYSVSTGEWTWMSGEQTGVNPMGNYGTQGIPSTTNYPPALGFGSNCWTDTAGNLWLFGGFDQSNFINSDNLWRYTITTNEWTWVSGSGTLTGTSPIYGPLGVYGPTYYPGSRAECKSGWVIDNELWLFGGQDNTSGAMSDLWSYNTLTNQWAWKGGSSNVNAPGNYGTLGVASPTNEPPARCSYTKWKDADNNLYLFAGGSFFGFSQVNGLNDTWKYDLQTKLWTWINGSNSIDHPGMTPAFCQPDATKYPRSRIENQTAQTNSTCVNAFWTFGGFDFAGNAHNDLWLFNTNTNEWTHLNGQASINSNIVPFNYGNLGVPSNSNLPPGRGGTCTWTDNLGNLWIFGGGGNGSTGWSFMNDLWKFIPDTSCIKTGLVGVTLQPPAQTTLCPGDTITLLVPTNVQIDIQPNVGYSYNSGTGEIQFYGPSSNTYTVSANSLNPNDPCFINDTISFSISGYNLIHADFALSPAIVSLTNPVVELNNLSSNATSYEWYLNGVYLGNSPDLTHTFSQTGTYCFTLIAKGDCNQIDSITKCCEVIENGIVSFPNVFSPNGDNLNDVFRPIIHGDFTISNFQVYNRWGQAVFTFRNYSQKPEWDGSFQGQKCEMGTYFYLAEISDVLGKTYLYKGDIMLLR